MYGPRDPSRSTEHTADGSDPTGRRSLGVLGGMGPAAGAEFLRSFIRRWPARRDQDHPRVLLLSEPAIPDRSAALLGAGPDPTPDIGRCLGQLTGWGVDLIAVPCNTAFAFIDRMDPVSVPIVHTVRVAVAAARARAPCGAWLLATGGTAATGLYEASAATVGYSLHKPEPAVQRVVQEVILAVKAGAIHRAGVLLQGVAVQLSAINARPFLLGCTDLSIAWRAAGPRAEAIDSIESLAAECVRRMAAVSASCSTTQIWTR